MAGEVQAFRAVGQLKSCGIPGPLAPGPYSVLGYPMASAHADSIPPTHDIGSVLMAPLVSLAKWAGSFRSKRGTERLANELIRELESVASMPLTDLEVEVADGEESDEEHAESSQRLDAFLDTVRRARGALLGSAFDLPLQSNDELSRRFSLARKRAVARLDELERVLVAFGAGTDADAHLGQGLISPATDESSRGILSFEL